ncbi:MAG: hypothetical protein Q8896_11910 [Bacteroidota bacterium]|nr:hypothetical protein [Bacteroidota bacterium]
MKAIIFTLCAAMLFIAHVAHAQVGCERIRNLKREVYLPTESGIPDDAALQKIDSFWHVVKRSGSEGLYCLKQLITEEKRDSFFLADAVELMLKIDSSIPTYQLAMSATLRSNMLRSSPFHFLALARKCTDAGLDISGMLNQYALYGQPVFLEYEAFMVQRQFAINYLVALLSDDAATAQLEMLLRSEDLQVHYSAVAAIAMLLTERGFQLMDSLRSADSIVNTARGEKWIHFPMPPAPTVAMSRAQILDTLKDIANGLSDKFLDEDMNFVGNLVRLAEVQDIPLLRAVRHASFKKISKHNFQEHTIRSYILLAVIDRLGLYTKYRK